MYSWASPEKLLDEMSLEQLVMYYRRGWDAKKLNAELFWGVLGQALTGEDKKTVSLDKFKQLHPDGKIENGAWKVSR